MTEPAHPPTAAGSAPAADRQETRSWLPLLGSAVLAAALIGLLLLAKYET